MEKGKRDNEGKRRNKEKKKKARMGGEERKVGRERDRQDYISLQGTSEKIGFNRTKMKPAVFNFLGSLDSSGIPVEESFKTPQKHRCYLPPSTYCVKNLLFRTENEKAEWQ